MQRLPLIQRLADHWPLGLAVALALAFIPLANWLGVILALVILLRMGTAAASLGYALVALAACFTLSGYSLSLATQEWAVPLVLFLPLWVMAWLLQAIRSLSLSLAGGILAFMAVIVLIRLVEGPTSVEQWMGFLHARLETSGMTQAQFASYVPGQDLRGIMQAVMLTWPLSISLIQVGLLLMARWIQARCYYPGGFQRDFHSLKQPKGLAFACMGLILCLLFASEDMVTLIHLGILALVLMGVTGLGRVHRYFTLKGFNRWWLVLVYGFLVINTWVALMVLATVALLDSSFNFNLRRVR